MAAKTNKTSEIDKETAEITAGGNEYVATEGTKQKLLEVVTAKINAMSVPRVSGSGEINSGLLTVFILMILLLATAVIVKKRKENAH